MDATGSTWVRARSLRERRAALPGGDAGTALAADASSQADTLLRWWEDTYFAGRPALFARRLRAEGLTREGVRPLLVADAVAAGGASVSVARWEAVLAEILELAGAAEIEEPRFTDAVAPFRAWAAARLDACLARCAAGGGPSIDGEAVHASLAATLNARVLAAAGQTFILRMHRAKLLGRLTAATPGERFAQFVRSELIDRDGLAALLEEYPVLARTLATITVQATEALCEMVERLVADWADVRDALGLAADDRLTGVAAGLGDTHRDGRTVMRLGFASGGRAVYKPRSMAVDVHTQELIGWLNARGLEPALRTVTVLDRGEHGWMEMVEPSACGSREEIENFYRRQGALLLVAYLLDATDFHWENVIAAGEHPVLVDLETLFQAPPGMPRGRRSPMAMRGGAFNRLVIRTGLLPLRIQGTAGVTDLSGLSDAGGQQTPYRVPDWENENTDEMRLVYRPMPMETGDNVPRLGGQPARVTEFRDALMAGFADAYRLVLAQREALMAADGPLQAFREDRVRHVLRETIEYALLLQGAYHPSTLRDGVDRDFLFDALWPGTLQRPYLARLTPGEQADLWNGDVPYFTARVGERDLYDSGERRTRGFFPESGLERVLGRLAGFGADDLARQLHCIGATLDTAGSGVMVERPVTGAAAEATNADLLAAAERIGERLVQLAVVEGDEAHWVAPQPLPMEGFAVGPIAPDLYDGTAGVALFLAYLARQTGREDFGGLARMAYEGVRNHFRSRERMPAVGAFQGDPSMLYAALHLAELWDDPSIVTELRGALGRIRRDLEEDRQFDVMGGTAGCVLVMLRLHERYPELGAFEAARAGGRHLLRHMETVEGGAAWTGRIEGERPLLGLSHGAAGIAWALSELAAATADRRVGDAAARALAYERAWFDPATGNWPDFRVVRDAPAGGGPRYSWSWCHGAPGIGIARLKMRRLIDNGAIDEEIRTALCSTTAQGFTGMHNLCHGDLGNGDLLLLAARELGEAAWEREARRHAGTALCEAAAGGWRADIFGLADSPGLMTGLSGIGYQLLRLADPAAVPSVLALEPPRRG